LGLPPWPTDFSAPVEACGKVVAALKRPPRGSALEKRLVAAKAASLDPPMKPVLKTSSIRVLLRGGGDLASGVAWRLHQSGFKIAISEISQPLAVRRTVSFCEAVYEKETEVEGVGALCIHDAREAFEVWAKGRIPVMVDPDAESRHVIQPHVLVDAILAKRNLGTTMTHAPLVIALGPGFEAGRDVHYVVETNRGHRLGRLLTSGSAQPDTGVPGPVLGITAKRVLRAPDEGLWESSKNIGDLLHKGETVGRVKDRTVQSEIEGVLRGLIKQGISVTRGQKIGDVDPRGDRNSCFTISEKALAIAGGVLEGILRAFSG
jgi:xanthine dehydrogenase accessory factor